MAVTLWLYRMKEDWPALYLSSEWLSRTCRELTSASRSEHTLAQEIEVRATVGHTLDELQAVHLALDLPIAEGQSEGGRYRRLV